MNMLSNNNKGERVRQTKKRYKKRVKRIINNTDIYINSKGEVIHNPKAIDVIKEKALMCYKTTSTPCSCSMCSPRKARQDRAKEKSKFKRSLKD